MLFRLHDDLHLCRANWWHLYIYIFKYKEKVATYPQVYTVDEKKIVAATRLHPNFAPKVGLSSKFKINFHQEAVIFLQF